MRNYTTVLSRIAQHTVRRAESAKYIGIVAFVLPALACGTTEHNARQTPSVPTAAAPTQAPAPPPQSIYHIGDRVEVYSDDRSTDVVVTVSKVDIAKSGNPYITPHPGGEFLTVDMTIENKANQPFNVSSLNFEVRDDTGQSYSSTLLPDLPQPPSGEIAPADKVRGVQAYDVPSGHSFRLYFKAQAIGSRGQTIFDLGQR